MIPYKNMTEDNEKEYEKQLQVLNEEFHTAVNDLEYEKTKLKATKNDLMITYDIISDSIEKTQYYVNAVIESNGNPNGRLYNLMESLDVGIRQRMEDAIEGKEQKIRDIDNRINSESEILSEKTRMLRQGIK